MLTNLKRQTLPSISLHKRIESKELSDQHSGNSLLKTNFTSVGEYLYAGELSMELRENTTYLRKCALPTNQRWKTCIPIHGHTDAPKPTLTQRSLHETTLGQTWWHLSQKDDQQAQPPTVPIYHVVPSTASPMTVMCCLNCLCRPQNHLFSWEWLHSAHSIKINISIYTLRRSTSLFCLANTTRDRGSSDRG